MYMHKDTSIFLHVSARERPRSTCIADVITDQHSRAEDVQQLLAKEVNIITITDKQLQAQAVKQLQASIARCTGYDVMHT